MTLSPLAFDSIIIGIIALCAIILSCIPYVTRRFSHPLVTRSLHVIRLVATMGMVLVLYGSFIEPRLITVNTYTYDLCEHRTACAGRDTRIVLLSDLHVGPYKQSDFVQQIVDRVNELKPDNVIIAGDFVFERQGEAIHLEPLAHIRSQEGVTAVLGNHDFDFTEQHGWQGIKRPRSYAIQDKLSEYNVDVLRNAVYRNKSDVTIIGQDDAWSTSFVPATDLVTPDIQDDQDELVILVQHNPDIAIAGDVPDRVDFILSGHTHGGQVRLPLIGSLVPLPTQSGRRYDQGEFIIKNNQRLFITRGLGETGVRARLFAMPEIVVLDIRH